MQNENLTANFLVNIFAKILILKLIYMDYNDGIKFRKELIPCDFVYQIPYYSEKITDRCQVALIIQYFLRIEALF